MRVRSPAFRGMPETLTLHSQLQFSSVGRLVGRLAFGFRPIMPFSADPRHKYKRSNGRKFKIRSTR